MCGFARKWEKGRRLPGGNLVKLYKEIGGK